MSLDLVRNKVFLLTVKCEGPAFWAGAFSIYFYVS